MEFDFSVSKTGPYLAFDFIVINTGPHFVFDSTVRKNRTSILYFGFTVSKTGPPFLVSWASETELSSFCLDI